MTTLVSGNLIGSIPDELRPRAVLVASSLVDQNPTGLGVPMQISYGPAQTNDDVEIAADGALTILETATYRFTVTLAFTRSTSSSEVIVFARAIKNGAQVGVPFALLSTDDNMTVPIQFSFEDNFAAGDVITSEIIRDSAGTDNGGLTALSSSHGWGIAPSANLRLIKV